MMMMQMMSNQRSGVVLPESVVPPPPLRTPVAPTVTGTIRLPHDAVIDIVDEEDSKYDEDPWRINDSKLAPPKSDQI